MDRRFPIVVSLAAWLVWAGIACAQSEDDGYVPTPTNLLELLPPEGLGSLACDEYWKVSNPEIDPSDTLFHRRVVVADGCIEFFQSHVVEEWGWACHYLVLDEQGELVETGQCQRYSGEHFRGSHATLDADGEVIQGKLVSRVNDDEAMDGYTREFDLEAHAGSIHGIMVPLAIAYHLREGNEQFEIQVRSYTAHATAGVTDCYRFEMVGTEQVEYGGEQVEAFVLVGRSWREHGPASQDTDDFGCDVMWYCLPNGRRIIERWDVDDWPSEVPDLRIHEPVAQEEYEAVFGGDEGRAYGRWHLLPEYKWSPAESSEEE